MPNEDRDEETPTTGWYPDPWRLAEFRWFDGTQWTGSVTTVAPHSTPFLTWPARRRQWLALGLAALVGLAIWIPTAAMQLRESHDRSHPSEFSGWYLPLMVLAAVALGAAFDRSSFYVAFGLVAPQFLLAPWTTPRGDNDGLWALIFPFLVALLFGLFLLAGLADMGAHRLHARHGP